MSFSGPRGEALLAPLKGRTTTFVLEGREANAKFARLVSGSLSASGMSWLVLDLDAFFSSNADYVFAEPRDDSKAPRLRVPTPGADIETEFSSLFVGDEDAITIDSLNTFYHLVSANDGRSKGRKIMFALESLSQLAKSNGKTIMMNMYRREGSGRSGRARSISYLSDITASVRLGDHQLELKSEKGAAWNDGSFFSRIP